MVWFLMIDFVQNIWGWITLNLLLCKNYASSHCSMLSTCCIKATMHSIKYFICQKVRLLLCLINWQLTLLWIHKKVYGVQCICVRMILFTCKLTHSSECKLCITYVTFEGTSITLRVLVKVAVYQNARALNWILWGPYFCELLPLSNN